MQFENFFRNMGEYKSSSCTILIFFSKLGSIKVQYYPIIIFFLQNPEALYVQFLSNSSKLEAYKSSSYKILKIFFETWEHISPVFVNF